MMKRIIALVLIFCILIPTVVFAETGVEVNNHNYGLTNEKIDQLSNYIYQNEDGSLSLNKEESIKNGYNEEEITKMENLLYVLNEKIESGETYIGSREKTDIHIDVKSSKKDKELNEYEPLNFGMTPIAELKQMVFCLSKNNAHTLRNELQNRGLTSFKQFLISAGISGVGLFKHFGYYAFIGGVFFWTSYNEGTNHL